MDYYLTSKEETRYAFFKFDVKRDRFIGFDKNAKPIDLTNFELLKIENLINKKVTDFNKETKKKFGSDDWAIKKTEKYFKQIIAVINSKGEKEIWVSCSCKVQKDYWKKHLVRGNDGGNCYFYLVINLTKSTIIEFGVNGLA